MTRISILVANLFLMFLLKFVAGGPTATVKAPATVTAGKPFLVEVTIKPNGTKDFMRFSMELPDGWTAEKVQTDGADFYFEKNAANDHFSAKFLWSRVGDKDELKISFNVTPSAGANGTFQLASKLSHTVDNLPENIQLDPVTVKVEGGTGAPTEETTHNAPDTTAKPTVSVSIARTVPTDTVKGEFLVDLLVDKDDLSSFGKLEDSLPAGCTATAVMKDGADFTFDNGVARFYWYVLPKKQQLHVQYKVIVSPDLAGKQTIYGHFSYIESEAGKIYHITPSTFQVKENPAVVVNDQQNPNSGNNAKESNPGNDAQANGQNQNQNQNQQVTQNQQQNQNQNPNQNQQVTQDQQQNQQPGENASVRFSVQIGAFHRNLPVSYFSDLYKINEPITDEQIDGLNKYITGSFANYADARNHRESLKQKGVTGPFVTAYNKGKRITVQEALMIAGQKWIS